MNTLQARAASGSEEEHLEPDVSEFKDPQDTLGPGSGKYDNATIEPMEETLNPEMEKNATHYIIFKGRQLFKPKLISQWLSSDSAQKVTIWPLCAQGVSVLEMLNRWLQVLNQSQEDGVVPATGSGVETLSNNETYLFWGFQTKIGALRILSDSILLDLLSRSGASGFVGFVGRVSESSGLSGVSGVSEYDLLEVF
ncbi:hypothetical protein B0H34DRAFT_794138 [Crassisporium funariophilum]|nr:hypothetical protein B0H34DRAFT_794138 [Crassisporium funariophilum]